MSEIKLGVYNMSDKRLNKLASKLIKAYNEEQTRNKEQDTALFNTDYSRHTDYSTYDFVANTDFVASEPKSAIEDLNANINEMGPNLQFALCDQPLTYVITVHIRNLRASKCDEELIKQHMSNLELTYGASAVESIVKLVFPIFHKMYYESI